MHPLTFIDTERLWRQKVDVSTERCEGGVFQLWQQSPLLVQVFMSAVCRLLFITGENADLVVVTVLKNSVL